MRMADLCRKPLRTEKFYEVVPEILRSICVWYNFMPAEFDSFVVYGNRQWRTYVSSDIQHKVQFCYELLECESG